MSLRQRIREKVYYTMHKEKLTEEKRTFPKALSVVPSVDEDGYCVLFVKLEDVEALLDGAADKLNQKFDELDTQHLYGRIPTEEVKKIVVEVFGYVGCHGKRHQRPVFGRPKEE